MKEKDILELLNKMTLDEKIGQLVQIAGEVYLQDKPDVTTGPLKSMNLPEESLYNIGSILNTIGAKNARKVQERYLKHSRLKIPLMFMADIINGYKTVFPIPLAQGCSWNRDLVKKCTKIEVEEAKLSGLNANFYPMVDLSRDSRWGRVMESIGGEDPYLGQEYAKVIVKEEQGEKLNKNNVAACVKHFAAYGAVESGRDYNTVDMSEREFRRIFLTSICCSNTKWCRNDNDFI